MPNFILDKLQIIRRRLRLIIILTIIIIIASAGYRYYFLPSKSNEEESSKVQRGSLEETLTISGELDADEKATLRFQTSGRLTWVGVKEGDYVKKYQSIASLDKREVEKNLKKELNDYMNERWDLEQTRRDYSGQAVTDDIKNILDKAQFDLDNTVLDVEIKDLAVEYSNLFTPIAGIVTLVEAPYPGTNITAATAEFEIVNPHSIFFLATADQTEVIDLKEGMTGELVLDSYPEVTLTGTIENISFIPKTGETGTVYSVKFFFKPEYLDATQDLTEITGELFNADYRYRVGMTGDLTFVTQEKQNAMYLPLKYIK